MTDTTQKPRSSHFGFLLKVQAYDLKDWNQHVSLKPTSPNPKETSQILVESLEAPI